MIQAEGRKNALHNLAEIPPRKLSGCIQKGRVPMWMFRKLTPMVSWNKWVWPIIYSIQGLCNYQKQVLTNTWKSKKKKIPWTVCACVEKIYIYINLYIYKNSLYLVLKISPCVSVVWGFFRGMSNITLLQTINKCLSQNNIYAFISFGLV